ncbi:POLIA [Symbiodinium sp. CCMP2456]|nr:POLIA [Symbiodinium sp. CCMP2456]
MGVMDLTVGDLTPEKGEKKCCCCCCSCFGFVVFILLVTSFQQVNRLNAGLLRNSLTGEVGLERAYLQGRYFVGFWNEFLHFPTTLNTIEFADEAVEEGVQQLGKLRSRDKDGKQIWLDVSVQYRIYPEELPQIYREMTKVYEDVYISELRGALQQVTNEFAIDQAWRDYPSVQKKMHDVCKAVLLQRHAECWGLQLWGIRLQVEYENQLIRTQVRKQAEETARATQLQTEYRQKTQVANVTIINQKGVADKNRIERDSVSAAQSALVTAQGRKRAAVQLRLKIVQDEVQYQRILMLKNKKSASPGHIFFSKSNELRSEVHRAVAETGSALRHFDVAPRQRTMRARGSMCERAAVHPFRVLHAGPCRRCLVECPRVRLAFSRRCR